MIGRRGVYPRLPRSYIIDVRLPPRAGRQPFGRTLRVTCRKGALDLGPNLAVELLKMSETGIRVVVRDALAVGQEVPVGLELGSCGRRTSSGATRWGRGSSPSDSGWRSRWDTPTLTTSPGENSTTHISTCSFPQSAPLPTP